MPSSRSNMSTFSEQLKNRSCSVSKQTLSSPEEGFSVVVVHMMKDCNKKKLLLITLSLAISIKSASSFSSDTLLYFLGMPIAIKKDETSNSFTQPPSRTVTDSAVQVSLKKKGQSAG